MKVYLVLFLVIIFIVAFVSESSCQMNRRAIQRNNKRIAGYSGSRQAFAKRYNFIGLSLNAMNYYGDLSPLPYRISTDASYTQTGFGFSAGRKFGPRFMLHGQFLYGTLSGGDRTSADSSKGESHTRYLRNLSFRNHVKELSIVAYIDLFRNLHEYSNRPPWTPYAFFGLALLLHNPKAETPAFDLEGNALPNAGEWISLRSLGTEGQHSTLDPTDANYGIKPYSSMVVAIPLGIGSRIRINDLLDLWIEVGVRYTFTDYLDDVSKNYVDLGVLKSPQARAMSYRTSELGLPTDPITYLGRDQNFYTVQNGYGHEHPGNIRGNTNANDVYIVTGLRITRVIRYSFELAKHR